MNVHAAIARPATELLQQGSQLVEVPSRQASGLTGVRFRALGCRC